MKRNLTIDLAKGFTVLCIAPIHTLLVYSQPYVGETLIGKLLAFIAEWHGAQIFMLLMGIAINFKDPQPLQNVLRKSGILLIAAYALNTFKFVIPYFFNGLPSGLLMQLSIDPADHPFLNLLLIADILHFAAIAYLITAILYNQKEYAKISLITAISICFISPLFYDTGSCNPFINYIFQIFSGQPPQTFFPIFPWLVYPLLGLWLGSLLKKDKPIIAFDSLWLAGVGILFIVIPIKYFMHDHGLSLFYRTRPLDTCMHFAAIFIFLSVWNWIANHTKPNPVFQLFSYCSQNITSIYLIQWVLIMWLMPIFGFRQLGWLMSMMAMAAISFVTLSLSLLFKLAIKKPK